MYIAGVILPMIAAFSGLNISGVMGEETIEKNQEITVDENLHSGKIIVLSDGSTWEVAPESLKISESWIFPSPLKIEKINHLSYPYKITNTYTGSSILARPITPSQGESLGVKGAPFEAEI